MKRIVALVLALIMVVLAGCGGGGSRTGSGKTYDRPLKLYAKVLDGSLTQGDMKMLYPEEYWDYLAQNETLNIETMWTMVEVMLTQRWAMLDEAFGENYRVTYRVTEEELLDEDDDLWPGGAYGLDTDKVDKAYEVTVEYTITGTKMQLTTEAEGVVYRYKGQWYANLELEGDELEQILTGEMTAQESVVENQPSPSVNYSQYREPLDSCFRILTDQWSESDVERIYPQDMWDARDTDPKEASKSLKEDANEVYDALSDSFGRNVEITYEIWSVEKFDQVELEDLQDEASDAGLRKRLLTDGC